MQSSQIVLVQVISGILLWTYGAMSRKQFVIVLTFTHSSVSGLCYRYHLGSFEKRGRIDLQQASTDSTNCQGPQQLVLPKGCNSL